MNVWWQPGILIAFGIWLAALTGATALLLWWGRRQVDRVHKLEETVHVVEREIGLDGRDVDD